MDFNPSKCQSGSTHHNIQASAQHICILYGQALETVDYAKYLGVYIGKDLSWNIHINRITSNNWRLGF